MDRKPYVRPTDRFWYMRRAPYRKYMLREASSLFIGLWLLNLLIGLIRLSQGEVAWDQWLVFQKSVAMVIFSMLTLGMALLHTSTWFAIAPKAMPRFIAGKELKHQQVVVAHWLVFSLVSLGLIFATIGGL